MMRRTGSSFDALTVWVAPNSTPMSSLLSRTSTAMIVVAPAMRAPWMTLRPTPPQPKTATVLPAATRAVLMAAPTPVVTPHPTSAAWGKGMSSSMGTAATSGTTVYSPMVPTPAIG